MVSLLKVTNTRLEEVRIEPLNDESFHATLKLRQGKTPREVEARPGDAIALAVQANIPIYLTEAIIQAGAWELSDPLPIVQRLTEIRNTAALGRAVPRPHR